MPCGRWSCTGANRAARTIHRCCVRAARYSSSADAANVDPRTLQLLAEQYQVVTVCQAQAGLGGAAVRWLLESGRWQRAHPRVLVAHSGPLTSAQLDQAALLHAGAGGALAGLTALGLDGLRGFPSPLRHAFVRWGDIRSNNRVSPFTAAARRAGTYTRAADRPGRGCLDRWSTPPLGQPRMTMLWRYALPAYSRVCLRCRPSSSWRCLW